MLGHLQAQWWPSSGSVYVSLKSEYVQCLNYFLSSYILRLFTKLHITNTHYKRNCVTWGFSSQIISIACINVYVYWLMLRAPVISGYGDTTCLVYAWKFTALARFMLGNLQHLPGSVVNGWSENHLFYVLWKFSVVVWLKKNTYCYYTFLQEFVYTTITVAFRLTCYVDKKSTSVRVMAWCRQARHYKTSH